MTISSDQSRAARGLLNWTQDDLAKNSCVSRATVADFENNSRAPLTNNLRSMSDSMFAAGVEFISEDGTSGVGIRFRERKLQYVKSVKIDRSYLRATMRMTYADVDFLCHIELTAVDDYYRDHFRTDEEYIVAISKIQHIILASVEKLCATQIPEREVTVTYEMLS